MRKILLAIIFLLLVNISSAQFDDFFDDSDNFANDFMDGSGFEGDEEELRSSDDFERSMIDKPESRNMPPSMGQVKQSGDPRMMTGGERFRQMPPNAQMGSGQFEFMPKFSGQFNIPDPRLYGANNEEMMFGMLFSKLGNVNPDEIRQLCSDPDKMADVMIDRIKAKFGSVSEQCNIMEKEISECSIRAKDSCNFGAGNFNDDLEHNAYSCPVKEDAIYELCVKRSAEYSSERLNFVQEICADRFETDKKYSADRCSQQQINCDKNKFMQDCLTSFGNVVPPTVVPSGSCPQPPAIEQCRDARLEMVYNNMGCVVGSRCVPFEQKCKTPEPIECSGGRVETHTDQFGCTLLTCIREEHKCTTVPSLIQCENGYAAAKTDEFGCIISYACVPFAEQLPPEKQIDTTTNDGTVAPTAQETIVLQQKLYPVTPVKVVSRKDPITGNVVMANSADFHAECEQRWNNQRMNCESFDYCNKDKYVENCVRQEKESNERQLSEIKINCKVQSRIEARKMVERCSREEVEKQRCVEQSARRCSEMGAMIKDCRERLNEENFRQYIKREAESRCKLMRHEDESAKTERLFAIIIALRNEDDIGRIDSIVTNLEKLFEIEGSFVYTGIVDDPNLVSDIRKIDSVLDAKISPILPEVAEADKRLDESIRAKGIVDKLNSIKEDVPDNYRFIIENEAGKILDISEGLGGIEQNEESKGVVYVFRRWFGFVKEKEKEEIENINKHVERLDASITNLETVIDDVPDLIAKSIIKEQIESLKKQKADLEELSSEKESKSKGLFGLFG